MRNYYNKSITTINETSNAQVTFTAYAYVSFAGIADLHIFDFIRTPF